MYPSCVCVCVCFAASPQYSSICVEARPPLWFGSNSTSISWQSHCSQSSHHQHGSCEPKQHHCLLAGVYSSAAKAFGPEAEVIDRDLCVGTIASVLDCWCMQQQQQQQQHQSSSEANKLECLLLLCMCVCAPVSMHTQQLSC